MRMLQTHASAIFLVIAFILMGFRQFSTAHTNKVCMLFRFDILSKRFQIDACTMKTLSVLLLVWTKGLDASNYMRFQTNWH